MRKLINALIILLYPYLIHELNEAMFKQSRSQRRRSRPLARSNSGSLLFMDFPPLCACSESSLVLVSIYCVYTAIQNQNVVRLGQGSRYFQRMTKGTSGDEVVFKGLVGGNLIDNERRCHFLAELLLPRVILYNVHVPLYNIVSSYS